MPAPLQHRAALLYRRDPAFLLALGRSGEPLVRGVAPGCPVVFLHDPALIAELLSRHHGALAKGAGHGRARGWLGASVLVAEGAEHARLRAAARPAFSQALLGDYAPAVVAAAERQIAGWRDGEVRDLVGEMSLLATAAVLGAFAGAGHELAPAIDAALAVLTPAFGARRWPWTPLAERMPFGAPAARAAALADLDAAVYALVDAALPGRATPLLAHLARVEPPGALRRAARDALVTLLLAGRETMAAALCWLWHLLARSSEVEAALHAELDALEREPRAKNQEPGGTSCSGERKPAGDGSAASGDAVVGRALGAADLERLPLAGQIFSEALRLYPPAWATARRARADVALSGARIRASSLVLFSQLALHRDGRWFDEPEQFRPQRWAAGPPPAAYMPFGVGHRRCLGAGFARLEAGLAVAVIGRRWRLRPLDGREPAMLGGPALMPLGGLPMRLEARAPHYSVFQNG